MIFKFFKRCFLFFTALLLLVFLSLYLVKIRQECQKLNCLKMKNLDKFKVQEVYQDNGRFYRALLSDKNDLIRVEVKSKVEEDEAEKNIEAEITRMKALFQNAASPYPGEVSDEIECSEEFKPVFKTMKETNPKISYFSGFLNSRLTFGVCTQDQAVYKGILALFYCSKQKQVFQLEMIAPKEEFSASPEKYQEMVESAACGAT